MKVLDHGIQIEALELFRVIEFLVHGIGQGRVLVQDVQAKLIGPPVGIRIGFASAVSDRALGFG